MIRFIAVAGVVVVAGWVFLVGFPSGPASKQEVCEQFDELGTWSMSASGLIDNMVFYTAGDLADTAERYSGPENLSADVGKLARIADSSSTDNLELMNATTQIANLCGYPLGMSAFHGGSREQNAQDGTAGTPAWRPQAPAYTPPSPTYATPSKPVPTTESTTDASDYRKVVGPAGLSVSIPEAFQLTSSPSAVNQQAADPANPDAFLRFGGSPAPKATLRAEIESGERTNPNVRNGYQRLQLTTTSFQDTTAVDWEFTFIKDGRTRHAYGRYWRVGTTGYVVYASAPADQWYALQSAFNHMIESAETTR